VEELATNKATATLGFFAAPSSLVTSMCLLAPAVGAVMNARVG
jgi:hypothetical protein